jgi:outer membrane protein assembly factor BamE (lipoprotein component of BamABCDE complex)
MKRLFLLCFVVSGMFFLVTGCAYHEQNKNIENSKKLRRNMTKAQVLKAMGEPVKDQDYSSPNVWFYYINTEWYDGLTTEDECLPLIFKNGKLAGWGWDYFERARIQHKYGK